jgi:hypothetical protein
MHANHHHFNFESLFKGTDRSIYVLAYQEEFLAGVDECTTCVAGEVIQRKNRYVTSTIIRYTSNFLNFIILCKQSN